VQLLDDGFQHDVKDVESEPPGSFGQMLGDPKVYVLSLVYFLLLGATYTLVFWMPTLIQSWGVKDLFLVGIFAAIPNALGVVGMILMGRHSDKHHERRWHFAVCIAIAAVGLFAATLFQGNLVGSVLAMCFATIGISSATPLFFALISEYLSAGAAAGGIALISSLGNLGPAVSPSINGLIVRNTGDSAYSIYFVIVLYLLSGTLLLLTIRPTSTTAGVPAAAPAH
jgi:nitrate/nitrite transporter NarK